MFIRIELRGFMKKLFILICTILISTNISFANMGTFDAGTLNRDYVRDMRLHEFETRERNNANLIQREKQIQRQNLNIPASVPIKKITFVGNTVFSSNDLSKIVGSNIGEIATEQNIINMRKLLVKYYNANGYYSTIILPDINNLPSGELIFQIKEGDKNSITIQ